MIGPTKLKLWLFKDASFNPGSTAFLVLVVHVVGMIAFISQISPPLRLRTDMYSAADKEGNVTTKKPWTPQETLLLLEVHHSSVQLYTMQDV